MFYVLRVRNKSALLIIGPIIIIITATIIYMIANVLQMITSDYKCRGLSVCLFVSSM